MQLLSEVIQSRPNHLSAGFGSHLPSGRQSRQPNGSRHSGTTAVAEPRERRSPVWVIPRHRRKRRRVGAHYQISTQQPSDSAVGMQQVVPSIPVSRDPNGTTCWLNAGCDLGVYGARNGDDPAVCQRRARQRFMASRLIDGRRLVYGCPRW